MFGSLNKKTSLLTPAIYESVLDDIRFWFATELNTVPPKIVDGKQVNALLNFATFDIHALMTDVGFKHMYKMLTATGTEQTVMIRLKDLVCELYLKYGDEIIDELRSRVYNTMSNVYGLEFDIENTLDVNNTFWLHPFIVRLYTELNANSTK